MSLIKHIFMVAIISWCFQKKLKIFKFKNMFCYGYVNKSVLLFRISIDIKIIQTLVDRL